MARPLTRAQAIARAEALEKRLAAFETPREITVRVAFALPTAVERVGDSPSPSSAPPGGVRFVIESPPPEVLAARAAEQALIASAAAAERQAAHDADMARRAASALEIGTPRLDEGNDLRPSPDGQPDVPAAATNSGPVAPGGAPRRPRVGSNRRTRRWYDDRDGLLTASILDQKF